MYLWAFPGINRKEEKLLRKRSYRQKIAEVIFNSIKAFKEKYETGIATEAASTSSLAQ